METTKCKLNPELVRELDMLEIKNINFLEDNEVYRIDIFLQNESKIQNIIWRYFPQVCGKLKKKDIFFHNYAVSLADIKYLFSEEEIEWAEVNTFRSFANEFNLDKDLIQ